MPSMADPMEALRKYQQALNTGMPIDDLDEGYLKRHGKVPSGHKFDCVKIVGLDVQALAIFGEESPFEGLPRFSLGYAVGEYHRGNNLAFEAVSVGIEELKKEYRRMGIRGFYLEALISETNVHSINVAKKICTKPSFPAADSDSGTPSLCFHKLIVVGDS